LGLRARMEQARQVHHRLVWLTALFFVFCFVSFTVPFPGGVPMPPIVVISSSREGNLFSFRETAGTS
jgi:hypothetical protein